MIRIRGLRKSYGASTVLDDVSAEAPPGSVIALLGASGSGKSTLLRCLNGLTPFDAGELEVSSFRLNGGTTPSPAELLRLRAAVGMVFQELHLFPHLSVLDNVSYGLKQRGVGRGERDRLAREALELVQLRGLEARRPRQLSGGQQQRVALARALVMRPRVLLLDEPLGALDLKLRKEMQIELKRLQTHVGISFVYVTHDQEEAMAMSDRIAVMARGKIEQLDEFRNGDGHPAIAARPQGVRKVVAALERPAVEPEAGLAIDQVLDVQQELAARFLDVRGAA